MYNLRLIATLSETGPWLSSVSCLSLHSSTPSPYLWRCLNGIMHDLYSLIMLILAETSLNWPPLWLRSCSALALALGLCLALLTSAGPRHQAQARAGRRGQAAERAAEDVRLSLRLRLSLSLSLSLRLRPQALAPGSHFPALCPMPAPAWAPYSMTLIDISLSRETSLECLFDSPVGPHTVLQRAVNGQHAELPYRGGPRRGPD